MPHQSFGAVRAAAEREPTTFDFGLYGEETFTVVPEPSLGDTFDLHDAPEPTPTTIVAAARAVARFIRRMLVESDRARFDQALYRIPSSEAHVIIEAGEYITRAVLGFPSEPAATSSDGRQATGRTSSAKRAGNSRSRP